MPASSSGSSPTSTTVVAASRSAYVAPSAAQHDLGGEERRLLGRVRAGAEVDVVGAERDARELAVGVGVLGGEPAAGQHADGAGVARQAAGGDGEGLGPRRGTQLAPSSRSRTCG